MKILICGYEYYPFGSGIASVTYNTKRYLTEAGHEVDVCSAIGPEYTIENSKKFIEKFGGLGILYFWYKVGKLLPKIEKKYDKIFLHNPFLFKHIKTDKIICVAHTFYYHMFKEFYYKNYIKIPYYLLMILFEAISYKIFLKDYPFIVTARETRNELKFYGITNVLDCIYNGACVDEIATNKTKSDYPAFNTEHRYKFLFVGRMDMQKNLFKLIDAYSCIKNLEPNSSLIMVGDGALKKKLEDNCKKHNIKDIYFTGKIPYKKLLKNYCNADFFLAANDFEGEGYSVTLSESMAAGVIQILSPIRIHKDLIEDIGAGIIADFTNRDEAAKRIVNYIHSIDIKKERNKTMDVAHKKYNWTNIVKQYLKYCGGKKT